MIGKHLIAVRNMIVKDIEDCSLPDLHIKRGDVGVITGIGDYPNGKAYEVKINGDEIFVYKISPYYWEIK
jgi:hypothetical protein